LVIQVVQLDPLVADDPVFTINVFALQSRHVCLGPAQVPEQSVKRFSFLVTFSVDDPLIFLALHRPLFGVLDLRPGLAVQQGSKQPLHIERKVVEPPKIIIGRDLLPVSLQALEKFLGLGFDHDDMPNHVEGCVLHRGLITILVLALLRLRQSVHHVFPGARLRLGVAGRQVRLRDLPVDLRLDVSFVASVRKALRFAAVARLQTFLFPGLIVLEVKDAIPATVKAELLFHAAVHQCARIDRPRTTH
jgi:hypothetical protein